ncbi:MAG: hypothetical protein KJ622_05935 [Alphaproteobacteria bacterium]|nr:hypothetical protein [Alphaproteobacteria bacterium]
MQRNRAVVFLANLIFLGASLISPALAQWQPTKPVELWVTFGKGAHADLWAREVVSIIENNNFSPVPITVVNIPKGVGVEAFPKFQARSADNHTLMLILPNAYTVPIFKPEIGFDVMKTTPIANMGEETLGLWVNAKHSDIKTIDDLVRVARAKGAEFKLVGPPSGTPRALLSEMIIALYGLDAAYVGIKKIGSTARALTEKGYDAAIFNSSEQLALPDKLTNRLIAFLSHDRLQDNNHIPTLRETGMAIEYSPSRIVIGPPQMSREAAAYYAALIKKVYETSEWQKLRQSKGHIGKYSTGQSLSDEMQMLAEKHKRWKMAVEELTHRRPRKTTK